MPSDPSGPQWIFAVLLIVLCALCNLFTTSAIALGDAQLKREADGGDRCAIRLRRLTQDGDRLRATSRFFVSLCAALGAVFVADDVVPRVYLALHTPLAAIPAGVLHALVLVLLLLIYAVLLLVFADLIPRRLGGRWPIRIARGGANTLTLLCVLFKPFIALGTLCANGTLRLFRVDPNAREDDVSEEEILYMVDVGEEKGAIERSEKEMIANIFEFSDLTAGDVMIHRTDVQFLSLSDTADEWMDVIRESGYSRFPVYGENMDDISGLLITRDYLLNLQLPKPKPFRELLTAPYFVPEAARADRLFHDMQNGKIHMAIVVDEYGGTSGIVTLEDLLERIVGDIYDETDEREQQDIQPLSDGRYRIAGRTPLADVSEALHIHLPEDDDLETLGGLILSALPKFPQDGETPTVRVHGLQITVERMSEHRVEWAIAEVIKPEAEQPIQK